MKFSSKCRAKKLGMINTIGKYLLIFELEMGLYLAPGLALETPERKNLP